MKKINATGAQAGFLTSLAHAAADYRSTLLDVQRYAEQELEALTAGHGLHGHNFQMLGEMHTKREALAALTGVSRYALDGMDRAEAAEALQLAIKGKETLFLTLED